jgi:Flp pilus assembly protein TadG
MTRAVVDTRRTIAQHLTRRSAHRRDDGVAAIEFAMLVPVYLLLLVGMVDMGGMLYSSYQLETAVAAGAEYAAVNSANANGANGASLANSIAGIVENANGSAWANDTVVVNNGPTVTVSGGSASSSGTATNANSCYCPAGSPPNWVWGSAATCGAVCSGSLQAGKFVTITASVAYTPLLSTFGLIKNGTLTQNAMVQVQ